MKVQLIYPATLFALMAIGACRKSNSEHSNVGNRDKDFMNKAAYANQGEIAEAKLATAKDSTGPVRVFAMTMISDHTTAEQDLGNLADSLHVGLPQGPDPADAPFMQMLQSLNGHAFDTAYVHAQVTDHQKAIALFQGEADSGENVSVKAYAAKYLPKLQMHLMMADSLSTMLH